MNLPVVEKEANLLVCFYSMSSSLSTALQEIEGSFQNGHGISVWVDTVIATAPPDNLLYGDSQYNAQLMINALREVRGRHELLHDCDE